MPEYVEDCIFCKIANKEIPVEVVYETETLLAFPDIDPKAPVHILIIPKGHIDASKPLSLEESSVICGVVPAAQEIAATKGILEKGYRLVTNNGPDSGQEVEHMHFHLLGGRRLESMG